MSTNDKELLTPAEIEALGLVIDDDGDVYDPDDTRVIEPLGDAQ